MGDFLEKWEIFDTREIFDIREIFDRGDDFKEVNRSVYLEKEKSTS